MKKRSTVESPIVNIVKVLFVFLCLFAVATPISVIMTNGIDRRAGWPRNQEATDTRTGALIRETIGDNSAILDDTTRWQDYSTRPEDTTPSRN